jgi:hypothetical protein
MERNIVRNKHFIVQLMRTNYKILRLLKIVKIIRCVSNDTNICTRYVILAKHWMWLPDDGFM